LKQLLLRAFNENQLLLLKELEYNSDSNITNLLKRISESDKISLSTLKFNSRVLRDLNLASFGNGYPAGLTDFGRFIVKIIRGGKGA